MWDDEFGVGGGVDDGTASNIAVFDSVVAGVVVEYWSHDCTEFT